MKKIQKKSFPIIVLDEHPDWLNPLYEAFTKRGYDYVKIDINSAFYDPTKNDIFPFYINRLSPSAAKRGHDAAFAYTFEYVSYLEGLGARVINGSHTVLLETSKAAQSALLRKLSLPQPKTIVLNDMSQIKQVVEDISFPVMLKPNRGGSGMQIQRFDTKESLLGVLQGNSILLSSDHLILLQEYIKPKDGYIVRVETINKKVVYAMKVYTKDIYNLCPSDSCDVQITDSVVTDALGYCAASPTRDVRFELYQDIPCTIVVEIEKLVQAANLECGGIEYVVGENGQWYIYDINALSILRSSFKEEYGIDGWAMLADYFILEYEKYV